jgi:hypothetical protein
MGLLACFLLIQLQANLTEIFLIFRISQTNADHEFLVQSLHKLAKYCCTTLPFDWLNLQNAAEHRREMNYLFLRWRFCAMLRKPFPAPFKGCSEKHHLSCSILKHKARIPTQETVESRRSLRRSSASKTFWIKSGWSLSDKVIIILLFINCNWVVTRWQ